MSENSEVKVLVVEDDALVAEMIEGVLEESGYLILAKAHDGKQAVELALQLKPDVILMDLQLPVMNGLEAAREIAKVHPTPIVVLTAYESPGLLHEAERAGVGAFLVKPPNGRVLERAITISRARFRDLADLRTLNERLSQEMAHREEKESEYRSIIRTTADGFWTMNVDGDFLDVNQAFADTLGYRCDEMLAMSIRDVEAKETAEDTARHMAEVRGEGTARFETRHRRKDGQIVDVEISTKFLTEQGKFVVFCRDITLRKRSEEALRESERHLRRLYEESPLGYQSLNQNGEILDVNPRWLEMLGYGREEILGLPFSSLLSPADAAQFQERFPRFLQRGHTESVEFSVRTKSGATIVVSIDGRVALDANGYFAQTHCVLRDITEAKRLEQEHQRLEASIRQQQKLKAIGTLASGVAHEINNPLNVVMNYAQLILDDVGTPEEPRAYATAIINESERMATIVRNLLAFSRNERERPTPADMRTIVHSTLSLIRSSFKKRQVDLVAEIPEGLPPVLCRAQQIQQVLMNLLTNACDAVDGQGADESGEKLIRIVSETFQRDNRPWVRVTVEDKGRGIAPEIAEHVFEPFFTTKPKDEGTGLGLAISYGIMRDHGGSLWFETEPGQGTRFHMELCAELD